MQHLQSYYCSTTAQKKKKEEECNIWIEIATEFIHSYNSF